MVSYRHGVNLTKILMRERTKVPDTPIRFKYGEEVGDYVIGDIVKDAVKNSRVYHARHKPTGKEVMCKYLNPYFGRRIHEREVRANEALCGCPNSVLGYDFIEAHDSVCFFMDSCENGDLLNLVTTEGALPRRWICDISYRILSALDYMHDACWTHRDVKLDNIFWRWDTTGVLKHPVAYLADFGFASQKAPGMAHHRYIGTYEYQAPELLANEPYTNAVDCWAFGTVLYAMATAQLPFVSEEDQRQGHYQEEPLKRTRVPIDPCILELIDGFLQPNAAYRLTVKEALSFACFAIPDQIKQNANEVPDAPDEAESTGRM
jgi:serine/threonine protein kinase